MRDKNSNTAQMETKPRLTPNIKYFFLLILFFATSCSRQENTGSKKLDNKSCILVKDSVDFGTGRSTYDKEILCLDTVFTFDYFETSKVSFHQIPIKRSAKILNWNSCTLNLSFQDSIVLQTKKNGNLSITGNNYSFESAYEISVGKERYLAVFLFPAGIMSHLIPYPVILINSENELVKFINEESLFSANPKCFCDIDGDDELDYMSIDYNDEMIRFYAVDKWKPKPSFGKKLKKLDGMVYRMH